MTKYGKKAQEEVDKTMHEGKYKNKQQSAAVGLSKARRAGGKAPSKKKSDN